MDAQGSHSIPQDWQGSSLQTARCFGETINFQGELIMNAPPGNAIAPRLTGRSAELTELLEGYQVTSGVQAQWERERQRLLALYLKTRSAKHWQAYCVHVAGVAARLEDRTP